MFDLCKILGVDEGEEFKVEIFGMWSTYKVERNRLMYLNDFAGKWVLSEIVVNTLAEAEIKRQPWIPKNGDKYYAPTEKGQVTYHHWQGNAVDYALLDVGFVFKTEQAALSVGQFRLKELIEEHESKR